MSHFKAKMHQIRFWLGLHLRRHFVTSLYRPISNLSLISKIVERVVKSRLSDHLTSNNLVNPHQSAY